jgi:hypothetical protein
MALRYSGEVEVLLIDARGAEHLACFITALNETVPGLFDLSMPYRLPAAQGAQVICVTLDDGRSLGGDVGYIGTFGLTFSQPRRMG